jgi:hypothetical protein
MSGSAEEAIDIVNRAYANNGPEYATALAHVAQGVLAPEPQDLRLCVLASLVATYLLDISKEERNTHLRAIIVIARDQMEKHQSKDRISTGADND